MAKVPSKKTQAKTGERKKPISDSTEAHEDQQVSLDLIDPKKTDVELDDLSLSNEVASEHDTHGEQKLVQDKEDHAKPSDNENINTSRKARDAYKNATSGFGAIAGAFGNGGHLAQQSPKDNGSKFIYIGFLVGGFFIILFGKWLLSASALLITILAALTIIIYGVYAGFSERHNKLRIDRVGDNCYYLGLTYTLASLIAALLALGSDVIGRVLLENFGTALISTAIGIIMRLILMQFRSEIDDAEQSARISLIDASEDFRQQLFSAKADFENFQTAMMMSIQTTNTEISNTLKSHAESLSTAVSGSIDVIDERVGSTGNLLTKFQSRFTELDSYLQDLGNSSNNLAKRMNDVHASPKVIEEAFDRLSRNLDTTSQTLQNSVNSLSSKVEASEKVETSMNKLEDTLMRIDALVKNMESNIEAQERSVTESRAHLQTQAEALKMFTTEAQLQGENMRAATNEVYGAMGNLAKVVIQGVKNG